MKKLKITALLFTFILLFSGFWSGNSNADKKQARIKQSKKTLALLYKHAPEAKKLLAKSYGYATFSSAGVNLIFVSAEGGTGMAHNNKTGKNIYMNMASAGVGLGLGVKDFRIVFLFANKKIFDNFVNKGWEANAQADAAAKASEHGGAVNASVTVAPGMRIYKLTKNGLALQATIQGTKYWKDSDLN
ncbi:hypothetical protein [Sulfurimonas autotrophica]|uniref:Putative lipoprotein n=1 Tax=Sulfurimonas autotrophica (strain ATCC BAA-671 / DSM 16294 / JCM 11897 / OK10) TaxID=563040 RepID=E0USV2_SULAO|nr:hypothetical protein [Sulfurimonas autotrophica]ADN08129.1 putative lipoprotein [Sulfurimonas autotrophica DSM 16294]